MPCACNACLGHVDAAMSKLADTTNNKSKSKNNGNNNDNGNDGKGKGEAKNATATSSSSSGSGSGAAEAGEGVTSYEEGHYGEGGTDGGEDAYDVYENTGR